MMRTAPTAPVRALLLSALLPAAFLALPAADAGAQIRVNPTGVNVNAQGATTVFLTFGGLGGDYAPAEAFWCGELLPADPDLGLRCDESTLFGRLPFRYDVGRGSGTGAFTDIMSIPPSVARRAYAAAVAGETSSFFYVRRFVSASGGPDQYVPVTCRLAGGGARVPFSLLDVRMAFDVETPVLFLGAGDSPPQLSAAITYNGTGRLKGRWEIVLPGEELPEPRDLLTEATLPLEERGTQRRYTELERFNVFLPPTGSYTLPGPDPGRLPTEVEGVYLVLLRVEASDDKEGDSSLDAVGAGQGVAHAGAVAGFPLPPLRYVVGAGGSQVARSLSRRSPTLLLPLDQAALPAGPLQFSWSEVPQGAYYRLEVEADDGERLLRAVVPPGAGAYRAPPWLVERAAGRGLRWRVVVLDLTGFEVGRTGWRRLRAVIPGTPGPSPEEG